MGVSAIFPRGSRVCVGRSGDAPRGFYARYGTAETGCSEAADSAAFMSIGTSFNALFFTSPLEAAAEDCSPISQAIVQHLGDEELAFPGHRSLACQMEQPDGTIQLAVYALARKWPSDGADQVPHVVYFASLGTRRDRLDHDVPMFRTFLGRIRIGIEP